MVTRSAAMTSLYFTADEPTATVFSREAADYGVLHFATHFLSDGRQAACTRGIVLGDRRSYPDVRRSFDAELNAERAALSACNTGLGKLFERRRADPHQPCLLVRGHAESGVQLVERSSDRIDRSYPWRSIYERLRSSASKKQALRQAKLDYLSDARGDEKDPFYWAPFILSGDWRPLALPAQRRSEQAWLVSATIALLFGAGALFVWKRRRSPS